MSISISCNTITYLKELQQEEKGYDEYFKWSMNEWKYEMINEMHFSKINEELLNEHNKISNNQILFIKHKDTIFKIAVEVLEELKEESLFKNLNSEFVLMFGISEFDDKEIEIGFAKRLNDETKFMEFKNWIDSEEQYQRIFLSIEIVRLKFTQLGKVTERIAKKYINEITSKYAPGTVIKNTERNAEAIARGGNELKGKMILEVPIQTEKIFIEVLVYAAEKNVIIRDLSGKIYK